MDLFSSLWPSSAPFPSPCLVALVGAGGKTSLLFGLASSARAVGLSVIVTTTTALRDPRLEAGRSFDDFLLEPELADCHGGAQGAGPAVSPARIAVLASGSPEEGKISGPLPSRLGELRDRADLVLVEADGSRGLPIKAPAVREPAMPEEADLVLACIGLDALGRPARAALVHRLPDFLVATGLAEGDPIDAGALRRLAGQPSGSFKSTPEGCRRILCLTKADLLGEDEKTELEEAFQDLGGLVDAVFLLSCGESELLYAPGWAGRRGRVA